MLKTIKWIGTTAGVAGAVLLALNIAISGWGFVLFLISSISWTAAAVAMREASLGLLQGAFVIINLLGIYSWLIN